jgi:hypothetical protein
MASPFSQILLQTGVPIGVMLAFAAGGIFLKRLKPKGNLLARPSIPLGKMLPLAIKGWLTYAGFLASMATFQVFFQRSPVLAWAGFAAALYFGYLMVAPIFGRARQMDNLSRSGHPEGGTKFRIEVAEPQGLAEILRGWASDRGYSRHDSSTERVEVFAKKFQYVSVGHLNDKLMIEAWVQRGKFAQPIETDQLPHKRLRADLNKLLLKTGAPEV